MSKNLPSVKPKEVIRVLKSLGFEERRVTGSHHIYRHKETGQIIPVPVHGNRDLKKGTLISIIRSSGLSIHEFTEKL